MSESDGLLGARSALGTRRTLDSSVGCLRPTGALADFANPARLEHASDHPGLVTAAAPAQSATRRRPFARAPVGLLALLLPAILPLLDAGSFARPSVQQAALLPVAAIESTMASRAPAPLRASLIRGRIEPVVKGAAMEVAISLPR